MLASKHTVFYFLHRYGLACLLILFQNGGIYPASPGYAQGMAPPPHHSASIHKHRRTSTHKSFLPTQVLHTPPSPPTITPPTHLATPPQNGNATSLAVPKLTEAKPDTDQQELAPPSELFGELFVAISTAHLFPDSKTIVDAITDEAPSEVLKNYLQQKQNPDFNLSTFVQQHFTLPERKTVSFNRNPNRDVRDYIETMWSILSRKPDVYEPHSSLLALPKPYIVPGGRFSEIYYWDSYFTMIGLYEAKKAQMLRDMVTDMASLIDRYGHIPNGNRTYYLSRSQPPFFALMIDLLAEQDGQSAYIYYLPELEREYDYWMDGSDKIKPGEAYRRVVRLYDGTLMNRHWDDLDTPRDESYSQDITTAKQNPQRPASELWRNLRAGSETGWDFSSRWLKDRRHLYTMNTTDLLTIELNSLIAHMQQTLSHAYILQGDTQKAATYQKLAEERIGAIQRLLWDPERHGFFDYDWKTGTLSQVYSAGMVVPLFLTIATPVQAHYVAQTVKAKLLKTGGLVVTDQNSGQQWDFPNGWAPLQWMAVKGFNAYGQTDLAREIAVRWMTRVIHTYEKSGVLLEKYDVASSAISPTGGKGGGEYPMQIGFGWTNGTLLGLMNRYPVDAEKILKHNAHFAHSLPITLMPPVNAYRSTGHGQHRKEDISTLSAEERAAFLTYFPPSYSEATGLPEYCPFPPYVFTPKKLSPLTATVVQPLTPWPTHTESMLDIMAKDMGIASPTTSVEMLH